MRKITRILALTTCVFAGAFVLLAGERSAHADNKNRVTAEALFDQGASLMSSGRFAEACAKFEAGQALDAGIGTLLYLGDCYERGGRHASAWATFREAESLARAGSQLERAQIAHARAQALEPKLPRLAVVVPQEHRFPGLTVVLAGEPVPPASYDDYLPIDPGEHRVVVSAPGYRAYEKTIKVAANAPAKYRLVVPLLQPANDEQESSRGSTLRTVSIVTGGAGVLAVGAGAVFGVMAVEKNDQSLEDCPAAPDQCTPRGVALRKEASDYADLSTVSFAAGGGLILTGIVLYIAAPSGAPKEKPNAAKLAELKVAPAFESRGLGLKVKGRF